MLLMPEAYIEARAQAQKAKQAVYEVLYGPPETPMGRPSAEVCAAMGLEIAVRAWWHGLHGSAHFDADRSEIMWLRKLLAFKQLDLAARTKLVRVGVPQGILDAGAKLGDFLEQDTDLAKMYQQCRRSGRSKADFMPHAVRHVFQHFEVRTSNDEPFITLAPRPAPLVPRRSPSPPWLRAVADVKPQHRRGSSASGRRQSALLPSGTLAASRERTGKMPTSARRSSTPSALSRSGTSASPKRPSIASALPSPGTPTFGSAAVTPSATQDVDAEPAEEDDSHSCPRRVAATWSVGSLRARGKVLMQARFGKWVDEMESEEPSHQLHLAAGAVVGERVQPPPGSRVASRENRAAK